MQPSKCFVLLGLVLAACAPAPQAQLTAAPSLPVQAYQTATASSTSPAPTEPVLPPTATPSLYTVVAGDTFFSIAARHEISLQALQLANPDVNSTFIAPGMQLFIPASDAAAEALPHPTAVGGVLEQVSCYPSAANELWCFLVVHNAADVTVENLSGAIQLLDGAGMPLETLTASPPLNILSAGGRMPLVAYLGAAPQGWQSAHGQLSSAYPLTVDDYYIPVQVVEPAVTISPNGLSAQVRGGLQFGETPGLVWVLAVAYDREGDVVGIRRWESGGQADSAPAEAFDLWVYSLGGVIERVELLAEAQP